MSKGNSTLTRIASAVVALPVYVVCLATDVFYSIPVLFVSAVISLICLYEYYQISYRDEAHRPLIWFGIVAGLFVNVLMYLYAFGGMRFVRPFDARAIFIVFSLFMTATLIYHLFKRPLRGGVYSLAVTVFGVMYIVFSFSHVILLKALNNGFYYIVILNVVVMINDAAAYFGGVFFGTHKTNFEVSPNKSWEGYFSGLLFSIIGIIITNHIVLIVSGVKLFDMIEASIIGIVLSVLGHLGDLVESAIKRDSAIKDSGSIIPGHGGMWDVFDALIFTTPLFYYYLIIKGIV